MTENFPYSYQNVADGFGITQSTLRSHKQNHKDQLIKNIDYVSVQDLDRKYKIFFGKSGVIKLADFVGTPKAKEFINQWASKTTNQETQISTQSQDISGLNDNQLLGMMKMMVASFERQAEKNKEIEDRLAKVESQKTLLNVIEVKTAKAFLTLKQEKKNEIGAEINELVRRIYIDRYYSQDEWSHKTKEEKAEIYKQAHHESRNDYWRSETQTYVGATKASYESKVKFLNWLKKVEV